MESVWRRGNTAWALVAALLLTVFSPTAASADDEDGRQVEYAREVSAWVFFDDGLVVLTGPALEQGCFGQGFATPMAKIVTNADGSERTTYRHDDGVWVFEAPGYENAMDWLLGETCPAVRAGEPAPTPLATGEGRVSVDKRTASDGTESGKLKVQAWVTTQDGRQVPLQVRGEVGALHDEIRFGG